MIKPSGLFMESTPDERFGVLPGEERRVEDVMHRSTFSIEPSRSLREAAEMMRRHQASSLVVLEGRRLAGILTERDMVVHGMTQDVSPAALSVRQVLGDRKPVYCRDRDILAEAARLMADHRLESIPVVNAEGTVVGTLTLLDVVGAVMPAAAATWLARVRHHTGSPERTTGR